MLRVIWGLTIVILVFAGVSRLGTSAPGAAAVQTRAGLGLAPDIALQIYLHDPPNIFLRPVPRDRVATRFGQFGQGDVCCPGIPSRAQRNIATGERLN